MSWHVDDDVWAAYVAGRLDPAAEASVDTHVERCATCRAGARAHVPAATTDRVWTAVHTTVTTPRPLAPLRLLRRLGVRDADLVVLAGANSLLVPWAVAVGFAVACACLVGLAGLGPADQHAAFLATAPLVPVLTVVAAYDTLDPLRELTAVTPYSALRLALLRAVAALAVALPATAAIGLVVPGLEPLAWVWLAPSAGLTLAALVLLTWWEAPVAATTVAAGWVAAVLAVRTSGSVDVLVVPVAQAAFGAAGVLLAGALVLRTSTLRLQGGAL